MRAVTTMLARLYNDSQAQQKSQIIYIIYFVLWKTNLIIKQ